MTPSFVPLTALDGARRVWVVVQVKITVARGAPLVKDASKAFRCGVGPVGHAANRENRRLTDIIAARDAALCLPPQKTKTCFSFAAF